MSNYDSRPVADQQRGSRRRAVKGAGLHWLCNPPVLKAIIALARLAYELAALLPEALMIKAQIFQQITTSKSGEDHAERSVAVDPRLP